MDKVVVHEALRIEITSGLQDILDRASIEMPLKVSVYGRYIDDFSEEVNVRVHDLSNRCVASFAMSVMPGCCMVGVSHNTLIYPPARGNGLANVLQDMKTFLGTKLGFSFLMCTTVSTNEVQNHLLPKHKWTEISRGNNKRTGNIVVTWTKNISEAFKEVGGS